MTSESFLMRVDGVFFVGGKGAVVAGRIEKGVIKINDEVEITGMRPTRKAVVIGIEMFNKILNEAKAGDNVGILLKDLKKEDIERGEVIRK